MAKIIRDVKLKTSDINKNSGKEISHTISKIKEHEMRYTIILTIIFMILIIIGLYVFISVSPNYFGNYYEVPDITYSSELISLDDHDVLSDEEGKYTEKYEVYFSNNTYKNINYIMRLINDEEAISNCKCSDSIVGFDRIRYSINDGEVKSFIDSDMIIDTGLIEANSNKSMNINFWLVDNGNEENRFFGKILIEQFEDMDEED